MRHASDLLLVGVSRLAVAGILVLVGTTAAAQEPPAPAAPPAAEAQPAPVEPDAPHQAVAPRIFQPAWEIVVDGKAEANGTLELVFQPHGGDAKLLKVNVVAKTKKDDIAKDLAQEITFAAGSAYKIKANGNKVKVKAASKKTPPCFIGIETQAVNGVAVRVGKG
jgi:cytoskeletal protein RodZ